MLAEPNYKGAIKRMQNDHRRFIAEESDESGRISKRFFGCKSAEWIVLDDGKGQVVGQSCKEIKCVDESPKTPFSDATCDRTPTTYEKVSIDGFQPNITFFTKDPFYVDKFDRMGAISL